MHHRETNRPSSTGHLIHRAISGSRLHLWRRERFSSAAEVKIPGRDLWILHPSGRPAPEAPAPGALQVLLLDGSWHETTRMAREVLSWGCLVSLPLAGKSRFWLRAQQEGNRFSTIEALLHLLDSFGLTESEIALRIQFELHVYSSLRSRGRKATALEFLKDSCLPSTIPALLAQLDHRRPN